MIFAVRDRLRAEQRHLASTRGALLMHSRHLLNTGAQFLASNRALLSAMTRNDGSPKAGPS